jgi:hypothetical protein
MLITRHHPGSRPAPAQRVRERPAGGTCPSSSGPTRASGSGADAGTPRTGARTACVARLAPGRPVNRTRHLGGATRSGRRTRRRRCRPGRRGGAGLRRRPSRGRASGGGAWRAAWTGERAPCARRHGTGLTCQRSGGDRALSAPRSRDSKPNAPRALAALNRRPGDGSPSSTRSGATVPPATQGSHHWRDRKPWRHRHDSG